MYPSVRDHVVLNAFPSLKDGLDALGIQDHREDENERV